MIDSEDRSLTRAVPKAFLLRDGPWWVARKWQVTCLPHSRCDLLTFNPASPEDSRGGKWIAG